MDVFTYSALHNDWDPAFYAGNVHPIPLFVKEPLF